MKNVVGLMNVTTPHFVILREGLPMSFKYSHPTHPSSSRGLSAGSRKNKVLDTMHLIVDPNKPQHNAFLAPAVKPRDDGDFLVFYATLELMGNDKAGG